jgi:hypothetical protein
MTSYVADSPADQFLPSSTSLDFGATNAIVIAQTEY